MARSPSVAAIVLVATASMAVVLLLGVLPALAIGYPRHPAMTLRASDFANGRRIPVKHEGNGGGCAGRNLPPQLSWTNLPRKARSLSVTMVDPDAGGFIHWVVYDIPASARAIGRTLPHGARQLRNSAGSIGYFGPCPPPGPAHHYRITLYALNVARLKVKAPPTKLSGPLPVMRGHILARATLSGSFKRYGDGHFARGDT